MNQDLRVNKTNFHMKGFALGLAFKQRRRQLGNRLLRPGDCRKPADHSCLVFQVSVLEGCSNEYFLDVAEPVNTAEYQLLLNINFL